jgi:hypothetical protein
VTSTATMRLCKNRLHPLEAGICYACKLATKIRGQMRRKMKPREPKWKPAKKLPNRRAENEVAEDQRRNHRLLEISDALIRNPMPWDRERLLVERAAIMAQKQKDEA